MSIRLARPSEDHRQQLLLAAVDDALTYPQIGISASPGDVPGFRVDRWSRRLGEGESTWRRACEALTQWQIHRGAGLMVRVDGAPAIGRNVAMSAPLPVGYVDVVCRVVRVEDEPDRFGFAYGTLSNHPECGEESFTVSRLADGGVQFDIVAASRPRSVLARALRPIARHLQESATVRYLDAMTSAATNAS